MQVNQTVAFFGIAVAGLSTMDALAQVVQRAPAIPPRYFWRSLGVPSGAQAGSFARSVSADGRLILGSDFTLASSGIWATEAWGVPRTPLPKPAGTGDVLLLSASDNATLMSATWWSTTPGVLPQSFIASAGGPWINITDALQPAFSRVSIGSMSADGTVFAVRTVDNATNLIRDFVFINGGLVDVESTLSAALSVPVLNVRVSEIAAYRRVAVGTCWVNGVAGRGFHLDLITNELTLLPNIIGGFSEPRDARVSGDGIVATVTWIEPFLFQTGVGRYINNGNGLNPAPLFPLSPLSLGGSRYPLNETGHAIAGDDHSTGLSVLWIDGVPTPLATLATAAGFPPSFSPEGVMDMSALDVIIGTGGNSANRREAWIARLPTKRIRSDFNRDGVCLQQQDVMEFNNAFQLGNLAADWNYDTLLTPLDQALFAADFAACR